MNVDQMRAVNAILLHDGESSNAELVYYFVHELDVTPVEAWRAVYRRSPVRRAIGDMRIVESQRYTGPLSQVS